MARRAAASATAKRVAMPASKTIAVAITCAIGLASMTGCGIGPTATVAVPTSTDVPEADIDLDKAAAENRSNFYGERFMGKVDVLDDTSGIGAVRLFFEDSETLIVSDSTDAAQLRAASIAVAQHAPMITYDDNARGEITSLIYDLGVRRVLLVGDVPFAAQGGTTIVTRDPGSVRAMGALTAFQFTPQLVSAPEKMVDKVAALDPEDRTELKTAWDPIKVDADADTSALTALPAQSRRDADQAPVVIATPQSPIAAVATVRAYGGSVRVMPTGDPRDSKAAYAMVAGLDQGPLVALGPVFETPQLLSDRIRQGWSQQD